MSCGRIFKTIRHDYY